MSDKIQVHKKDESSLVITTEPSIDQEIREAFSYYAPNYRHMPAYKNKLWDGKIYQYNARSHTLPVGLLTDLRDFAHARNYEICEDESVSSYTASYDPVEFDRFVDTLSLRSAKDEPIRPRDYQIDAVRRVAQNPRAVLLSPTASGKSLIIYMLVRLYQESSKCLLIVPTTNLVEQMYSDFLDYASDDDSFTEDMVHRIYGGKDRELSDQTRIVISTWQSIFRMPSEWFHQFNMVIGDEAHNFKAKSLASIMNSCIHAHIRVGTTGTLDGSEVHEMLLKALFGPIYVVTTTSSLIENQTLAQTKIDIIRLKYSEKIIKDFKSKGTKYTEEISYITQLETRNNFIARLALSQTSNTLVLYNHVETHGIPLYELICDKLQGENRNIYFISGKVKTENREHIRKQIENDTNSILVASLGTFSTGINIRNLHNIIFASPTKSQIRVLQSIGRGLRKHNDTSSTRVFDIVDDLSGWRKTKNYAFTHGIERARIYTKEKFNFDIHELSIS